MENNLKYLDTIKISKEIYLTLFGNPDSHVKWAESFNIIGEINKILYERNKIRGFEKL